ncbi:MAG: Uncharacterised protein [Porticoccaceae bacterium UBA1117]|nr:MAG: Uncharacterised protein [Porticoccaceae bacterium UBA1117]
MDPERESHSLGPQDNYIGATAVTRKLSDVYA